MKKRVRKPQVITAEELRRNLPYVLRDAQQGETICVLKYNRPVCQIIPIDEIERTNND